MKKVKIQSVDEALKVIENNTIIGGNAILDGDARTYNKTVLIENKALVYLYAHDSLLALQPLLLHNDFNVRLFAAYALLPLFEKKCKEILLEIANGDYKKYGIQGHNAEMILMMWNIGELKYPYQPEYGKKPNDEGSKRIEETFLKDKVCKKNITEENNFKESPLISQLTRIFVSSLDGKNEGWNDDMGAVLFNQEAQELVFRINTFVDPYTQDIAKVYHEWIERFKTFENALSVSANKPSKLGFMQIVLTIAEKNVTDNILMELRNIIKSIYNEWKPNECKVCFQTVYHSSICYFEGSWWYPIRAIIKKGREYERYDFSDETKFDEDMWNIVQGEYDNFEYSESFKLISAQVFNDHWEATSHIHQAKPF